MIILFSKNGESCEAIENVKGIRLFKVGDDINDWKWGFKFYHEDLSDPCHFLKFTELIAFIDPQHSKIKINELIKTALDVQS